MELKKLLKKPVFEIGNANWSSELPRIIKNYNDSIHNSTKMTLIQASKKSIEKQVYFHLQDRRVRQKPKYKLGQLVHTADI